MIGDIARRTCRVFLQLVVDIQTTNFQCGRFALAAGREPGNGLPLSKNHDMRLRGGISRTHNEAGEQANEDPVHTKITSTTWKKSKVVRHRTSQSSSHSGKLFCTVMMRT